MNTPTSRFDSDVSDLGSEAAESLHAAASSIRRVGHRGSRAIEDFTEGTATTLDDAGTYVEKQMVRRYPAESLALAAGVGFLTGIALLRLTHTCDRS